MRISHIAAPGLALLLSGCLSYGGGDNIKPLPGDLAKSAHVGAITVRNVPMDVSPMFKQTLEGELRTKTAQCAKGQQVELALEVDVAQLKTQDVAATILIGSSNNIRGQARFMRADTHEVVGDYDIAHSVGGGGILAAVGLSGAEKQMSTYFADEVCSIFAGKRR